MHIRKLTYHFAWLQVIYSAKGLVLDRRFEGT